MAQAAMEVAGTAAAEQAMADPVAPSIDAGAVELQVMGIQRELDALRFELNVLRRRDETLNFYMQRLDEELRLAARLQQDFLPKVLPQVGRVHFHTLFRPAGYVSGDLYDVMRLDERHIGFYMADAVGHGVPAALLTMFLKHALVTKEITGGDYRILQPGETMARLNEALIEQNLSQASFATALYGVIDVDTLQVTLSRAGHPRPLILRQGGELQTFPAEGSLLGIFPGEKFENGSAQLSPGDRLIIFSDGVEVTFQSERPLETGRWCDEIYSRRGLAAGTLLNDFAERLDRDLGGLQPKDDLTIIVLEVHA